jgi:class 3 adenylate cyclase
VQENFALWESYFGTLARSFRLITFDPRGTGMSERAVEEVSLDTMLLDARAVVEAAHLGTFAVEAESFLLSFGTALNLAITLPESVTHVVLEAPFQNMSELADTPFGRVSLTLAEADWPVFVQTLHRVLLGWDSADFKNVEALTKLAMQWVDAKVGRKYIRALYQIDIGESLGQVHQPTLVVRNEPFLTPAASSQRIASRIPGARFHQFSDPTFQEQARVIREFIGVPEPSSSSVSTLAGGTAVILFTDIADSTALTESMGDARFREASRALDAGLRTAIREAGGAAIDGKLLGDGVLATFPSAAQAINGARRCLALSAASELGLHIGLHAGDVIREEDNVFGGAVNIAARICALSEPGQILVSDVVRGMARSSAGVQFEDRGEQAMKGVGEPVRVYALNSRT